MSQPVFGLLPSASALTPEAQHGLHRVPEVAVLDHDPEQPLPATGRGRAFAASAAGGRLAGPVAVMWGKDATLASQLRQGADRVLVVVFCTSKAASRTRAALEALRAAGVAVHLAAKPKHPVRVLDDGTVQEYRAGSWGFTDSLLDDEVLVEATPPEPEPPAPEPEPAPEPPTPTEPDAS